MTGKRILLAELLGRFPSENSGRYIEPFRERSVALAVPYAKKLLPDTNSELINAYLTIRDEPEDLIGRLCEIEYTKDNYYSIRDWDRDHALAGLDSVSKAARLIHLNKTAFIGLFRVKSRIPSQQEDQIVPLGSLAPMNYPWEIQVALFVRQGFTGKGIAKSVVKSLEHYAFEVVRYEIV